MSVSYATIRVGVSSLALLAATLAAPAVAQVAGSADGAPPVQSAPASPGAVQAQEAKTPADGADIVVTGSLFKRRIDEETASPITVLTADTLAQRGITTIADALQTVTANGAGTLPPAFSANGAFAGGASAPSLRGLTTDSTLVLFDGLRGAYYPLSDDGTRNFVDLNTVPESIVERVDVLKDGASSTYGADAVAGVVNVIIKKQIKGFEGTAEGGISQRGDGAHQRLTATYGWGDLKEQGFNFYINAEYQNDAAILNNDRGFPFNTKNYTSISGKAADGSIVHGTNGNTNGLNYDGTYQGLGSVPVAEVAPVNPATGALIAGATYNPIAGNCGSLTAHVINQANDATDPTAGTIGTVCEYDPIKDSFYLTPNEQRLGATAHLTVNVGALAQAYAMFTFYQNKSTFGGYPGPSDVRDTTTTGDYSTSGATGSPEIFLPAVLTAGANAGKLNPNDPFAAQGYGARLFYSFGDIPIFTEQLNQTFRGAAGINGSFGNGWTYTADATGMNTNLRTTQKGNIYIAGLLGAIADGSYNFVNPSLNTQAVRDRISPTLTTHENSKLYQGQATIGKKLFTLPSGNPLNVAVGGAVRYESLYDPSANPDNATDPTQQYFGVNPFSAIGHRWVESGFFEIDAPIFKQLDINGSGRYDHYSTGFSHFSPKIGAKFTPIREFSLRGTFSKGFRVPSFAESNGITLGFSNYTPDPNSAFVAAHSSGGTPDAYAQSYSLGTTTQGTSTLKPETSRNFTVGVVGQPARWLSFTVDYYNIKKNGLIVAADTSSALAQYFASGTVPAGFSAVIDGPDPLFPNAQRRLRSITTGFINANSLLVSGIDASATATIPLGHSVKWTSSGDATYVMQYNETLAGLGTEHFAGTLGPIEYTAGSGTPRWRATWQNTVDTGRVSLTAVAYYTSGYATTSEDVFGPGTNYCSASTVSAGIFDDNATPIRCNVGSFVDVDMNLSLKVNDKFTFYVNVQNVADTKPPFDPVTYGGTGYNPSYAQAGILGRFFQAGAHFKF